MGKRFKWGGAIMAAKDKIIRRKFTTQLDINVLEKLNQKAQNSNFGSANKVIEALVNNFLRFLDDDGNIDFKKDDLPAPILKSLLNNFAEYLSDKGFAMQEKKTEVDTKSELTEDAKKETERQLDNFINSFKI
jgi:hypothetical protein